MNTNEENEVKQTININVPDVYHNGIDDNFGKGKVIANTLKKTVKDITNASFVKILKFFTTFTLFSFCCITAFFCYNVSKDQQAMNKIVDEFFTSKKEDEANMKIRDKVSRSVDRELKKLVYTIHASRAVIFELHNGKENTTSLPFRYVDMSYEVINDNQEEVRFVSGNFQNIPLTHYRMPFLVAERYVSLGTLEQAKKDDPRFGQMMSDAGGRYYGGVVLKSNDVTIGFLCVFFDKGHKPLDGPNNGEQILKDYAKVISSLLDLSVQRKEYYKLCKN